MAGNIKGIKIEIGGDTTPLEKALKGTNKTSRELTSELRSIDKSLKFNPKSTELLAQKQRVLKEAVANTNEKLKTLKIAQEQAAEALKKGEIGRDQYDALTREIIKAENQLKNYQGQIEGVKTKWEQVGDKLKEQGERIAAVGDKLTKHVTVPILAAGGAAVAAAKKTGDYSDRILDLTDITGMSSDAIQEWQYAAVEAGVSTEAVTSAVEGLVKKIPQLESEGGKATQALNDLGISYDELKNKSPDEQVETLMRALAEMDDPLQRNAAGSALFGGAWKDLAPLLGMGAEKLDEVRGRAHEMGAVLSGDALKGANDFRIAMDVLKEVLKKAGLQIGAELAPILNDTLVPIIKEDVIPIIIDFTKVIGGLLQAFNKLPEPVKKGIMGFVAITAALGPVLKVIGSLMVVLGKFAPGMSKIVSAFSKGGAAVRAFGTIAAALSSPVGQAVLAIAALAAIALVVIKNWDKIKSAAGKLKDAITEAFKGIGDKIKWHMELHGRIVDAGLKKIKQLFKNAKFELPKFKLPKFDIKGKFSINPPSVPKLSVSWHKAGAIFMSPTIFATPNGLHGVGDVAGGEAVLPIEKLSGIMADTLQKMGGTGSQYFFNVKLDEVSEIKDFIEMAKRATQIERQGEVSYG